MAAEFITWESLTKTPRTGDVVYLIGWPENGMTVGRCSAHKEPMYPIELIGSLVPCTWFDKSGWLHAVWFPREMLCYHTDNVTKKV